MGCFWKDAPEGFGPTGPLTKRKEELTTGKSKRRVVRREEALARGNREPGQALTGAALSGVPLCEGLFQPDVVVSEGDE